MPAKKRSSTKKSTKTKSTKKKSAPKMDIKPLTEFTKHTKKVNTKKTSVKKEKTKKLIHEKIETKKVEENKTSIEKEANVKNRIEITGKESLLLEILRKAPKLKKDLIGEIGNTQETEKLLKLLTKENKVQITKISRYNVYYIPYEEKHDSKQVIDNEEKKIAIKSREQTEQQAKSAQFLLEIKNKDRMIKEYQEEIKSLSNEIRHFKASEAYDTENMWEHISWEMASVLAEQKGITVDETIQYFKKKTGLL